MNPQSIAVVPASSSLGLWCSRHIFHGKKCVVTLPAGNTGQVQSFIREFPIASQDQDPAAYAAFMLVRCAPNGPSVPLLETFMKQQMQWAGPAVTDVRASLLQISKIAGFTQDSFEACLNNGALVDDINAVRARGVTYGVNGTPTFLINGKRYSGDMSVDSMSAIIDSML